MPTNAVGSSSTTSLEHCKRRKRKTRGTHGQSANGPTARRGESEKLDNQTSNCKDLISEYARKEGVSEDQAADEIAEE
jgi:hypothetical protein